LIGSKEHFVALCLVTGHGFSRAAEATQRRRALQATEKGLFSSYASEKHPSGPKGLVDFKQLAARLKSCPFKTSGFSATCLTPVAFSNVYIPAAAKAGILI
jgi:hypothetical protein